MKVLIIKDLRTFATEMGLLVTFELATIFSLALQVEHLSPALVMSLAFAISLVGGFVFSFRTVATEDASKGMAFLLSLPVTPGSIVQAKFRVNWLLTALNFAIVWGGTWLYCHLEWDLPPPSAMMLMTLLLIQCANNSLYLAAALAFTSARAIWLPFPVLLVAINVAVNWKSIAEHMPFNDWTALPWFWPLVLLTASLAMERITLHAYSRARIRREWA